MSWGENASWVDPLVSFAGATVSELIFTKIRIATDIKMMNAKKITSRLLLERKSSKRLLGVLLSVI